MTNVLICAVAVIIGLGGLLAIADGVLNDHRRRASLQGLRLDRSDVLMEETEEWLRHH